MTHRDHKRDIILAVSERRCPPLVPELELSLVTVRSPWWTMHPDDLDRMGVPEPFWAFAWAGGQSLARFILDNPHFVAGKHVIDFGTGGGIVGLAALHAGAAQLTATDIDPWAIVACKENLKIFAHRIELSEADWIGRQLPEGSILLLGDMSYERELCDKLIAWFETLVDCTILVGDAGRGFVDKKRFAELATYLAPADSDSDGQFKVTASVLLWKG